MTDAEFDALTINEKAKVKAQDALANGEITKDQMSQTIANYIRWYNQRLEATYRPRWFGHW